MAERFTGQRCEDCQGGLQYDKQGKFWECPYCGKIYERELRFNKVQIDGLAGINDLVRSTLRKIASLDFDAAEKDLAECEKIDHASIGTYIANIAFLLFKSFFVKERQQYMAKLNTFLQRMNKEFPEMEEEERQLYDFINSNDIYALLVVVYGSLKLKSRYDYLSTILDCEDVFEPNVSRYLLSVLLKNGNTDDADILITNIVEKNCKVGLVTVLNSYPAGDGKVAAVERILSVAGEGADLGRFLDSYFAETSEDDRTVIGIFLAASAAKVSFNTSAVIGKVFEKCTDTDAARKILASLAGKRLDERSTGVILNWCLYTCDDLELVSLGLKTLFESNSLFETDDVTVKDLIDSEMPEDIRAEKVRLILDTFKISNKNVDRILAFFLLETKGTGEYRIEMLRILAAHTASVPLSVLEKYVLTSGIDGESKGKMLSEMLGKSSNAALSTNLFASYLKSNVDAPSAREEIIEDFLDSGISTDSATYNTYLLNARELHSEHILDKFVKAKCRPLESTLDRYIGSVTEAKYKSKIAAIAMEGSFYISAENFVKYIMRFSEQKSLKVINAQKMIANLRGNVRDSKVSFTSLGASFSGNLTAAYFLTSADEQFVIQEIVRLLESQKIKTDVPIQNLSDGKKVKLRKYVEMHSDDLDGKLTSLASQIL